MRTSSLTMCIVVLASKFMSMRAGIGAVTLAVTPVVDPVEWAV